MTRRGGIRVAHGPELHITGGLDRASSAFMLAADLLLGRDAYGMEYLTAYRAGVLTAALA